MKLKPWQEKLLFCLLLGLLTAFAWWPVARCDFVALDDSAYVTGNPRVQAGLTLDGLDWAFRTGHSANWHPVTWLSHMLDTQLYGLQPAGHHLTNLALHLAATLLLFLVFSQMTGALWRSALVAALFSLHPLHVESVAWVSERKDVLSALFFMLTLWAYGRYARKSESRKDGRPSTTAAAPHHASRITHQPPNSDLRSSIFCLFYLLSLTFFALVLWRLPGHRYKATGWFWFLGTLVPVIGLVQVGEQAMADRYTYIPSIGLFILAAWGLGDIASRWPRLKPWLVSASAIVLTALVAVTRGQIPHWQNSEALFRHALAVTKDNAWVHCLLADILADAGNFDEAGVNCREALRLKPGFPEVEILDARILVRANKQDQAIAILSRLVQQVPADPVAHDTLGLALSQNGDLPGAIAHYRRALDLKPDYAGARFHLAALLAQQGDAAGAIDEYRQGLRWQPDDPEALNNLAWIRAANANPALRSGDEAVHLARRACELTRYQNPMLAGTLAAAYAESGRFDEAVATAQKARDLALASNQKELADRNRELLELYRSRQPYYEPPRIAAPSRQPIARPSPPAQGLP